MRNPVLLNVWLIYIAFFLAALFTPHTAIAQPEQVFVTKSVDYQKLWIDELANCESSKRADIKHLDSNHKYSYGYVQFQMDTWLSYGKPFGTTPTNIYSADLQTKVARSILNKGETWHWKTCVAKTTRKLGPYPHGS